jgi:hypothetical protein
MDKDGAQIFTRNKRVCNFLKQDHFKEKILAVNLRVKTPSKFYKGNCSIVFVNHSKNEL